MSAQQLQNDNALPSATPEASAPNSADELARLDAEDENLNSSLGIVPGATTSTDTSAPELTVLTLQLHSATLPPGKTLSFDLTDEAKRWALKTTPITIKEGVEYNVRITFKVNHSIVLGVRYIQVVKWAQGARGHGADRVEQMLGSYVPNPTGEPYTMDFKPVESPSGVLARSMHYSVHSRVVDDDGNVFADWEWAFKLAEEW